MSREKQQRRINQLEQQNDQLNSQVGKLQADKNELESQVEHVKNVFDQTVQIKMQYEAVLG